VRVTAQRALGLSSLALLTLALAPDARAGGMEVGDTGAEALGRGGAFVAKADNPTAVNYNPAGFAKLRGHHIAISANAVHSMYDFTRASDSQRAVAGAAYPTISSTKPWFAAPLHMMATTDLGIFQHVTFAAGFYAPAAAGSAYPAEIEDSSGKKTSSPQRYDLVETGGLMLFPSVGVAFRPVDWLDIGLTFQWVITQVQAKTYGTASAACETAEDPGCDIVMDVEGQDLFAPTGSAGVLLRPTSNIEVGALLRLPSKSELSGKANVTVGASLKRMESYLKYPFIDPESPTLTLTNVYPLMMRLGARYIFRSGDEERGDIEANFTFENWAAASERVVTIDGKSMNKPMDPVVMDSRLKNTFGLRLGGSYRLRLLRSLDLVLRAGSFFETESTDVSDTSLQVLGARRIGLTGGIGLRWGRFALDTAYAHLFVPSRVVNQSSVTAQDFTSGGGGPVVGNGTYRASVDILSVQLSVAFGAGASPERYHDPEPLPEIKEPEEAPAADPTPDEALGFATSVEDDDDGVRAKGVAPAPATTPCTGALCFNPDEVLRSAPPAAATPAPARGATRAAAPREPLPIKDEVSALMGEDQLPVKDEVDQLMGKASRKIKRARRARRYRRARARRARRFSRARRAARDSLDHRSSWSRVRHAPRGARCIRRDDLGRCRAYRHHGRVYVSRR